MEDPLIGRESGGGGKDRIVRRSEAIAHGTTFQKAAALVDLVLYLLNAFFFLIRFRIVSINVSQSRVRLFVLIESTIRFEIGNLEYVTMFHWLWSFIYLDWNVLEMLFVFLLILGNLSFFVERILWIDSDMWFLGWGWYWSTWANSWSIELRRVCQVLFHLHTIGCYLVTQLFCSYFDKLPWG